MNMQKETNHKKMETSYTKNERENIKQKSWWIIELQIYMYVFRSYTNEKKTKEISYHNKLVFEVFFFFFFVCFKGAFE